MSIMTLVTFIRKEWGEMGQGRSGTLSITQRCFAQSLCVYSIVYCLLRSNKPAFFLLCNSYKVDRIKKIIFKVKKRLEYPNILCIENSNASI